MLAGSICLLLTMETESHPGFFPTSLGVLRPHLEGKRRFLQVVFSQG